MSGFSSYSLHLASLLWHMRGVYRSTSTRCHWFKYWTAATWRSLALRCSIANKARLLLLTNWQEADHDGSTGAESFGRGLPGYSFLGLGTLRRWKADQRCRPWSRNPFDLSAWELLRGDYLLYRRAIVASVVETIRIRFVSVVHHHHIRRRGTQCSRYGYTDVTAWWLWRNW